MKVPPPRFRGGRRRRVDSLVSTRHCRVDSLVSTRHRRVDSLDSTRAVPEIPGEVREACTTKSIWPSPEPPGPY